MTPDTSAEAVEAMASWLGDLNFEEFDDRPHTSEERCVSAAALLRALLAERDAAYDALAPFARLAKPLVEDGAKIAIGLTDDDFKRAAAVSGNIVKAVLDD